MEPTQNPHPTWDGRERRTLNAAEYQLMADTRAKVEHMEKGMTEKIDELKNDVDRLTVRVERLCQSVTSYMEKTPDHIVERIEELIDEAFPNDPDTPDATPSEKRKMHRKYHARLIATALKDVERRESIVDKLVSHIVNNAATLIGLALLAYFGLGVHK